MSKKKKKSRLLFGVIIAVCIISTTPIITGLYLDDLEDVTITDIFNNQYIRYNTTTANWTNQNVTFGNPFNQSLNTTDNVVFNNVISGAFLGDGSGLTDLFDQELDTTDNVIFNWVTAHSFFGDGGNLTNISLSSITGIENEYLKLDCSNDPLTGNLTLEGNRTINATYNLTLGNDGDVIYLGNETDYIRINETRVLTLHGNARVKQHIRVTAPSWIKGTTAPTEGRVGIFPVWSFDKITNDQVYYSIIVPYKLEAGSEIEVEVDWCYTGSNDAGTVCWNLTYINVATGESVDGLVTTIGQVSTGNHGRGILIRTVFTGNIVGAITYDDLGLLLWRDTSEDTLDTDAHMIQVHFHFIMDKLGEPV